MDEWVIPFPTDFRLYMIHIYRQLLDTEDLEETTLIFEYSWTFLYSWQKIHLHRYHIDVSFLTIPFIIFSAYLYLFSYIHPRQNSRRLR